jgi:hypothetical protein
MLNSLKPSDIPPKSALLIDGVGAMVSSVLLFVLSLLYTYTGLPEQVLRILSVLALAFAVFSFSSHLWSKNHRTSLSIICTLNALYCALTGFLIIRNYPEITAIGLTYFVLEIAVLVLLVIFEIRIISAHRKAG